MKKYPLIGGHCEKLPKGLCKICGLPKSNYRVDVQVNNFRGDDEVYSVHKDCFRKHTPDSLIKILRGK